MLVASFLWMALTPSLSVCSCSSGPSENQMCMVNADCSGSGNDVCVMGKCQPPASGRVVAFSLTPPGSSRAAPTELSNYVLAGQPVTLVLDDKATVSATVMSEATFFPREAHVQVTIPSRIPGQEALQLGTEMANNMFTFSLAQARIGMDTMASFLFMLKHSGYGVETTEGSPELLHGVDHEAILKSFLVRLGLEEATAGVSSADDHAEGDTPSKTGKA